MDCCCSVWQAISRHLYSVRVCCAFIEGSHSSCLVWNKESFFSLLLPARTGSSKTRVSMTERRAAAVGLALAIITPVKVTLLWMSLSVFICSIFRTDHSPGELLHILFLAFPLSRSPRWCSWCENTKGSRFSRHTTPNSDHRACVPPL